MSDARANVVLRAVPGIPAIVPGDDLAAILCRAMEAADLAPRDRDVLVVSHKVVSKAENRYASLGDVVAGQHAIELAAATGKDPRLVELILSESREVLRHREGLILVEHRLGPVMANAGIDQSNVGGGERVLRLPLDPDASAETLHRALAESFGVHVGVVVCDSVGRAFRNGVVGLALGVAGLPSLVDLRGEQDLDGRELRVTTVGFADQIASAAELLMGEGAEGRPAVLVRGLVWDAPASGAAALVRKREEDLFR